ncbi:MAG TPA: hypothetical protein VKX49_28235 [Bryobacteraceae bacterium]|nr:hypothetical protein [Bryobacteraceae bacterium]
MSEKNGIGWFPTKRAIERFSIAPNVSDQNPLASIAKSFLDRQNQTGSDAPMLDAGIHNQLT